MGKKIRKRVLIKFNYRLKAAEWKGKQSSLTTCEWISDEF